MINATIRALSWFVRFFLALVLTVIFTPFIQWIIEKFSIDVEVINITILFFLTVLESPYFPWTAGLVFGFIGRSLFDRIIERFSPEPPEYMSIVIKIEEIKRKIYLSLEEDEEINYATQKEVEALLLRMARAGFAVPELGKFKGRANTIYLYRYLIGITPFISAEFAKDHRVISNKLIVDIESLLSERSQSAARDAEVRQENKNLLAKAEALLRRRRD